MRQLVCCVLLVLSASAFAADLPNSIKFDEEPLCSAATKLASFAGKQLYCLPEFNKDKVDLNFSDPQPNAAKFDKLLKTVLSQDDLGYIHSGMGNLFIVKPLREIKDMNIPVFKALDEVPNDMGYYTAVTFPKNVSSEDLARVLRNFMPPNTRIVALDANNSLVITGYGTLLHSMHNLLAALDVPASGKRFKTLRPIKAGVKHDTKAQ